MALYDHDRCFSMYLDSEAAAMLSTLWHLAVRSPRSLIYLPIRTPDDLREPATTSLDLVLLHHSLQFPPAHWKQLRARLGPGRVHTASVSVWDFPDRSSIDHRRWSFREFRDHLHFHRAANTLLIVGSRTAFREQGEPIPALISDAPSYLTRYPRVDHYCVELDAGSRLRSRTDDRIPGRLHIQYCGRWRI